MTENVCAASLYIGLNVDKEKRMMFPDESAVARRAPVCWIWWWWRGLWEDVDVEHGEDWEEGVEDIEGIEGRVRGGKPGENWSWQTRAEWPCKRARQILF